LENWGVIVDTEANQNKSDTLRRISNQNSEVSAWVVTAQEDRMIAVHVTRMEAAQL